MNFPKVERMFPVAEILPHRGRMVLIDEVIAVDGGTIRCGVHIRPDSAFVRGSTVATIVCLEYMAQTTGALLGLWAAQIGGRVTGGLLLGTPEFELHVPELDVGDRVEVECTHLWGHDDVWKFSGAAYRGGQRVAAGTLNVLRTAGRWEDTA